MKYEERHPLRSHETSRFRYSTILNDMVSGGFDIHHFILSSDVLRVITFPESLNGETGARAFGVPEFLLKGNNAQLLQAYDNYLLASQSGYKITVLASTGDYGATNGARTTTRSSLPQTHTSPGWEEQTSS